MKDEAEALAVATAMMINRGQIMRAMTFSPAQAVEIVAQLRDAFPAEYANYLEDARAAIAALDAYRSDRRRMAS
jgi:hypothetical protein